MGKKYKETSYPVPRDIDKRYSHWLFATGAGNKQEGLLRAFLNDERSFYAYNPELKGVFTEPSDTLDVELVAWYKAQVLLYLLEYQRYEDLINLGVPMDGEKTESVRIKNGNGSTTKKPERALAISMDVTTEIALDRQTMLDPEGEKIELLKLIRQTKGKSQTEVEQIIQADKKQREELFKNPFIVRFRVGVAAVSSDKTLSNTAGLEFLVQFIGIPQELIDEAYNNPNVVNVGPRLNLAKLVTERTDLISAVEMNQILVEDHQNKVEKGKGTKKRVKLRKNLYHLVKEAVVDGILPEETINKLLSGKPESQMLRTRNNIDDIIRA